MLGFHPALAPIKAAVLPLVKKDGMPELATTLYHDLQKSFPVFYDDSGAIGRRYRRMDEAGTPFAVTDRRRNAFRPHGNSSSPGQHAAGAGGRGASKRVH